MTSSPHPRHRGPVGPHPPLLRLLRPQTRTRSQPIPHPTRTAGPRIARDRNERWLHLTPPIQRNIGLGTQGLLTTPSGQTNFAPYPVRKKMSRYRGLGDRNPRTVIIRASIGPPLKINIATRNDISGVASVLSWKQSSVVKWKRGQD